jgi:hypothetical protein
MAATNKCLAQNNKSDRAVEATKKHAIGWISDVRLDEHAR